MNPSSVQLEFALCLDWIPGQAPLLSGINE